MAERIFNLQEPTPPPGDEGQRRRAQELEAEAVRALREGRREVPPAPPDNPQQQRIDFLMGQLALAQQQIEDMRKEMTSLVAGEGVTITRSPLRQTITVSVHPAPSASSSSFEVSGTETLYKVVALREYDANGVIVAAGSETGAADHTLEPTWDWVRAHA